MATTADDAFGAGRLIQWGLRVRTRPLQEPEYDALVERWLDHPEFRALVREVARGLGLVVLDVGDHGVVLGPAQDSPFTLRPANFRESPTVDDRLLDGLVQLAIAATIFPRARDLDEEATFARPPVTIGEVEETLRTLASRLEEQARGQPDPEAGAEEQGLHEAWRVYRARHSAMETRGAAKAARSTRRIIEFNLERLREFGCFACAGEGESAQWQPSYRYQVLVKELAASRAYELVRRSIDEAGD